MILRRTQDLPTLSTRELATYMNAIADEEARQCQEISRVPIPEYINCWRDFWTDVVDPVIAEVSRRIIAKCIQRNGPGGVEV